MSKSKLYVLDLMIVAKYLPTSQISQLKYISKSFKDIQERILINWNYWPWYHCNIIKSLSWINMFPNIQTINYVLNNIYYWSFISDDFIQNLNRQFKALSKFKQKINIKIYLWFERDVLNTDKFKDLINHIVNDFDFNLIIDMRMPTTTPQTIIKDNYTIYINNPILSIINPEFMISEFELCSRLKHKIFKAKQIIIDYDFGRFEPINENMFDLFNFNKLVIKNVNTLQHHAIQTPYELTIQNVNQIEYHAIKSKKHITFINIKHCSYQPIQIKDEIPIIPEIQQLNQKYFTESDICDNHVFIKFQVISKFYVNVLAVVGFKRNPEYQRNIKQHVLNFFIDNNPFKLQLKQSQIDFHNQMLELSKTDFIKSVFKIHKLIKHDDDEIIADYIKFYGFKYFKSEIKKIEELKLNDVYIMMLY